MAAKGDLAVALRIQADVADARRQLREFRGDLNALQGATTAPGGAGAAQQSAQASAAAAKALDGLAQASDQAARAEQRRAEILARTAGTTDQQAEAARRFEEFKRRQSQSSEEAAKGAAAEDAALRRLQGTLDPTANNAQRLADAQQRLTAALAAGKITQAQHNALMAEADRRYRQNTVSANQTAQAMRQLPAQFTDIFTSLASGQAPLLVLLQQGGQIKDSFGVVGAAAKALTGLINPMTVALAAAAVVAGVVAAAVLQLEGEQTAYSAALVATNNAAGTSIGEMRDYARQVAQVTGTTGAAADAIAQLAATGRVANADLAGAATIAVQAQRLLGREVSQTAQIYAQLGKDPVQALLRLNEGTNFLTASVLRQVMALKSQGQDQAAAALAQKAWAEQQTKVLADAEKNLGTLQRAWRAVADVAKSAWDAMLDIGRPKGAQEQIAAQERAVAALRERAASRTATVATRQRLEAAERRLAELREQAKAESEAAAAQAKGVADEQNNLEELDPARVAARAGVARAEAARALAARMAGLDKLREVTLDAFLTGEQDAAAHQAKLLELERARIRAQIAEVGRLRQIEAARPTRDENDALAKQASLTQLDTQRAGLEQQLDKQRIDQKEELAKVLESTAAQTEESSRRVEAAQAGAASGIDKAADSMQRWIDRNREALGITDRLAARLLDLARTQDRNGSLERAARALPDIEVQWLEATGRAAEASALQIQQRFRQLRADLVAAGELTAVAKVDVIINVDKARAELARLRNQVEDIFADEQLGQQRIGADIKAFRLTPGEAQDQRVQLARQTADRFEGQVPSIQSQIEVLPDGLEKSKLIGQLEQLKQRIVELRDETGLLQQAFTQTFAGGLANAIEGLATGTMSLRDAARALLLDIAQGMVRVAAQELASLAVKRLMIAVTGEQAAATVAAQATMTTAAVAGTTTVAAAQTAAATQVAAASAPAAAATATWSWGAAALAGLAALAAVYALARGFETGGAIRGPGTGTSDSIPIWASNGEFMVRERSVSQPGAQAFLEDFNARGMRALEAWRGYASGGLIGVPTMSLPAPASVPANFEPASPAADAQGGIRSLRVVNLLDKSAMDDWANTPSFERLVVNVIGRNKQAVRHELG